MRNLLFLTLAAMRMMSAQAALPTEWIDPDTGHRVIRLSREPGTASLYFHQNAYSADGKKLVVTNMHARTMNMEIAGHEFFSADGNTVWYDLQTPRSTVFWVAGVDLSTGHRTWYHLDRNEWSVHYDVSADGKLFAGDGGGPSRVAAQSPDGQTLNPPGNGQWIYLFRPVMVKGSLFRDKKDLIDISYFKSERLVNLATHNYSLEPNVTFSPDMKWVVFRSNMLGPTQVFAVEIAKP